MQRSFLRAFAGQFYRSITNPIWPPQRISPLRGLVSLPIVFDLVSLFMQSSDHKRTLGITDKYAEENSYHKEVQDYNAGVTLKKVFTSTRRFDYLYEVLSIPPRDLSSERLLIVGPRNRVELLGAWCHGFKWSNIDAIDLYSTHEKIHVMNMEAMSWPDGTFNAVSMAYTLAYANDTGRAIIEVARVLKSGGRFVFTVSYLVEASRWRGSAIDGKQISDWLHSAGFEIEVHQAADKITSTGAGQTTHIFMARKLPFEGDRLDSFKL